MVSLAGNGSATLTWEYKKKITGGYWSALIQNWSLNDGKFGNDKH
jgi:hypothetical protein